MKSGGGHAPDGGPAPRQNSGDTPALKQKSGDNTSPRWRISLRLPSPFEADLILHLHPPHGEGLKSTSLGELRPDRVVLPAALLAGKTEVTIEIS